MGWTLRLASRRASDGSSGRISHAAALRVSLETWEYGEVAEVVHVGPYTNEENDITRLQTFVATSGFRVIGDHEEEYSSRARDDSGRRSAKVHHDHPSARRSVAAGRGRG